MVIIGIDPGLKATGYGIIDCQRNRLKLLETGTIEPKQKETLQNRIHKIYAIVEELVSQYRPEVLVLEKLYAHYKHPVTATIMGHARGAICLLCAQKNLTLEEFSVKRIRKAITGNGNVTKKQTQRVVAKELNIDANKLTLDASDALALALGYIQIREPHRVHGLKPNVV